MRTIRLIAVGKLKQPCFRDAAAHYAEAVSRQYRLEESTVKDGPSKLGPEDKSAWEGERIIAALDDRDIPICLDERGKARASEPFAAWLGSMLEDQNRRPCFIVGGAFGLCPAVRRACAHAMSLGPMTMPHELARVVLLEQLYRASTIIAGAPYHHR
ncbi:MAG: 23S rRNA (pseudouridine(1915)-N(3))-methyltransferase RlmH [Oceanidesulfovibrio sp.]